MLYEGTNGATIIQINTTIAMMKRDDVFNSAHGAGVLSDESPNAGTSVI